MHTSDPSSLIAVCFVYVAAASIPALLPRLPVPGVVLEIIGGALFGPQILGLIHQGPILSFLSDFGLAVLFLMAGFEVDPTTLRGRPLHLAFGGWAMSAVIAVTLAGALSSGGIIQAPVLTGVALTTTAIGALMPILRDGGQLVPPYGPFILAAGAVGEAAPVAALSLAIAARGGDTGIQALLLVAFAVTSVLSVAYTARLANGPFGDVVARTLGSSGQLPMRIMLVLTTLLVLASEGIGIDAVLGAFLAGALARAAMPHDLHDAVESRLQGLGYGFLVPLFFIKAGSGLDLAALIARPSALLLVPLFAAAMLATRGLPAVLLYRKVLPAPQLYAFALHCSTQLPLVVAFAALGVQNGAMPGWQGAALVGGALLSLSLFPALAATVAARSSADAVP
jgi:Kef-type K+ transport system membrane component KefB